MTFEMKYMDPAEFRELGYLQEVNRRLLHPLGLALAITVDADGTARLSGIWDCREDPEGIRFEPDWAIDADAASRVSRELVDRGVRREARLGYIVQPVPEATP